MVHSRWSNMLGRLALASGLAATPAAEAQGQLDSLEVSPDITIAIAGDVLGPDEVGVDDLAGSVIFSGTGVALPMGVNLDAFERLPGGALFSTDIPVDLGNGVLVDPADVVEVRSGVPSILWSGPAAGLPPGSNLDAIARRPDGNLLLSFDTTLQLAGVTADRADLVRVDPTTGSASLALDSSVLGLAPGVDLDAADVLLDGQLLLSFDVPGSLGGLAFDDEDALFFDPATQRFAPAYDGSAQNAAWVAADLDVVDGSFDPDGDGIADGADLCPLDLQSSDLDTDGDFRGDECDLCRFYFQSSDLDRDGDCGLPSEPNYPLPGCRGDECECGDQSGDGFINVSDLVAINIAIFNPGLATPLCDANNDGFCSVSDLIAVNVDIFSPGNTSTCGPQPVPDP